MTLRGDSTSRATASQASYASSLAKKPGVPEHLVRDADALALDVMDFYKAEWTKQMASSLISELLAVTESKPATAKKSIEVGGEVRTKTDGTGTVTAIDGNFITVETSKGAKEYHRDFVKAL